MPYCPGLSGWKPAVDVLIERTIPIIVLDRHGIPNGSLNSPSLCGVTISSQPPDSFFSGYL